MTIDDTYGALAIPLPVPPAAGAVSDPALDYILAYLKAFINTHGAAAWAAVKPPADSLPVQSTFAHDPADISFNEKYLPAIFLYRTGAARDPEYIADDYRISADNVTLLWVFPDAVQEKQRRRTPYANGLTKLVDVALERGRDSSWVVPGDPDPKAATEGSLVYTWAAAWGLYTGKWIRRPVPIPKGEDKVDVANYWAIELPLTLEEKLTLGGFDTLAGIDVALESEGEDPRVTDTFSLELPRGIRT